MSIWTSKWTCPGWMFVPRKPHPMGNEYHTIACGKSGILYGREIVEGKSWKGKTGLGKGSNHYTMKKERLQAFYSGSVNQFTAQEK
eukprot:1563810-Ditylum_brightwellii.AAC.1